MRWLQRIIRAPDWKPVTQEAVAHFTIELQQGRRLLDVSGQKIMSKLQKVPAEIEYFFCQSQEAELILKFVERQEERAIVEKTQWFMDHYQRKITETIARKYAETHKDLQEVFEIKCEVAMIRNDYLALFKGLETQAFKLKEVVELHKAMLEDAVFVTPE